MIPIDNVNLQYHLEPPFYIDTILINVLSAKIFHFISKNKLTALNLLNHIFNTLLKH